MTSLIRPDYGIPATALAAGLLAAVLFRLVTLRYARRRQSKVAAALARHVTLPLLLLLPVFLSRLVRPLLALDPEIAPTLRHAGTLLLILSFGWLLISLISVLDDYLHERSLSGVHDDRRARRVLTRVGILRRVLTALVVFPTTDERNVLCRMFNGVDFFEYLDGDLLLDVLDGKARPPFDSEGRAQ